jgi:transposase-like protein
MPNLTTDQRGLLTLMKRNAARREKLREQLRDSFAERDDLVIQAREAGVSMSAVAEALGIDRTTAYRAELKGMVRRNGGRDD